MEGIAINISDLVRDAIGKQGKGRAEKQRPLDEAQVMELKAMYERYAAPCPFKPGDLVTPRSNSNYTDNGVPHIVLEVAETPIRVFDIEEPHDISSHAFGPRLDVRVGIIADGERMVAFWQESWQLEAWTPKAPDEAI